MGSAIEIEHFSKGIKTREVGFRRRGFQKRASHPFGRSSGLGTSPVSPIQAGDPEGSFELEYGVWIIKSA